MSLNYENTFNCKCIKFSGLPWDINALSLLLASLLAINDFSVDRAVMTTFCASTIACIIVIPLSLIAFRSYTIFLDDIKSCFNSLGLILLVAINAEICPTVFYGMCARI